MSNLKEEILKELDEMVIMVSRIPSTEKVFALDIKTSTPLKNWLSSKLDYIEKEVMMLLPEEKTKNKLCTCPISYFFEETERTKYFKFCPHCGIELK